MPTVDSWVVMIIYCKILYREASLIFSLIKDQQVMRSRIDYSQALVET